MPIRRFFVVALLTLTAGAKAATGRTVQLAVFPPALACDEAANFWWIDYQVNLHKVDPRGTDTVVELLTPQERGHLKYPNRVARFSPARTYVIMDNPASVAGLRQATLFDMKGKKIWQAPLITFQHSRGVGFSKDGKLAAVYGNADGKNQLFLYDIAQDKEVPASDYPEMTGKALQAEETDRKRIPCGKTNGYFSVAEDNGHTFEYHSALMP